MQVIEEENLKEEGEGINGLSFKFSDFEGPLDLLLELIKKSKMSIEDVKISLLTEQYIEYIQNQDFDLDGATEFVTMAAYLLEIKSRTLLPKVVIIDEEEENPEERLRQQLAAYAMYKEASKKMQGIETVGIHFREADSSVGKPKIVLSDFNLDGLTEALKKVFLRLSAKADDKVERLIVKDRFTVEQQIAMIKDVFLLQKSCLFSDLFDEGYSKIEIITTFLAILEMVKSHVIRVVQSETYSEIYLERIEIEVQDFN